MPATIPTATNLTPCPVVALFRGHCMQELRLACLKARVTVAGLEDVATCSVLLDIVAPGQLFEGDGPTGWGAPEVYRSANNSDYRRLTW